VIIPATGGGEWRGDYDRVSKRDRLGLTPDLTTRELWRSRRWSRVRGNLVYSSLWDFKSSFTCRKILRHGTFPLYFPSERKVSCGFLSPLKIHRVGRVLNAIFGSSGQHTNHYTTKAIDCHIKIFLLLDGIVALDQSGNCLFFFKVNSILLVCLKMKCPVELRASVKRILWHAYRWRLVL
jgi:hypothetical protein